MGRVRLAPYRQGELDGLCGLYSVVNAIRFAIYTLHANARSRARAQLDEQEAELLLAHLVEHLTMRQGGARFFSEGVGQGEMSMLLRAADRWLCSRRSVRLWFKCPLRRRRTRKNILLRLIADHLSRPGTAAIIAGNDHWRHWTVATKVTRSRLILFDSEGDEFIFIASGPRKRRFHAGLMNPPDLHLLTLARDTAESVYSKRRASSAQQGKLP